MSFSIILVCAIHQEPKKVLKFDRLYLKENFETFEMVKAIGSLAISVISIIIIIKCSKPLLWP